MTALNISFVPAWTDRELLHRSGMQQDDTTRVQDPALSQRERVAATSAQYPSGDSTQGTQSARTFAPPAQTDSVRRGHEAALLAAGGLLLGDRKASSAQPNSDGTPIPARGNVDIAVSPGSTPEETIAKADLMRAIAQMPSIPSANDRALARAAAQMMRQAQLDLVADETSGQGPRVDVAA